MNFATLRIIGMIVFFCLGVTVSMDEYSGKMHEIETGETVDEINQNKAIMSSWLLFLCWNH